jgi:hypothetical protein
MSTRARREQNKKVGFKEKKFGRLLFCKDLAEEDEKFLNYLNEERQSLNFFYGIGGAAFAGFGFNYAFFRMNSFGFQIGVFVATSALCHLLVRRQVNQRFELRVEPYFEKYQIK